MRVDVSPRRKNAPRPADRSEKGAQRARYNSDPAYRLRCVNRERVKRGLVPYTTPEEIRQNIVRPASRTCEQCGVSFSRQDKPGVIYSAFMRLRFCSHICAAASLRLDPVRNFWSKVEKTDGCWLWMGGLNSKGYGIHWVGKKHVGAHRFSFQLEHGDPTDKVVMHTCDNPRCVNPAHLRLGTQADNIADMDRKGRRRAARGSLHGMACLTAEQAASIRDDKRAWQEIAAEYPIGKSGIYAIRSRRTWRHL